MYNGMNLVGNRTDNKKCQSPLAPTAVKVTYVQKAEFDDST